MNNKIAFQKNNCGGLMLMMQK